MHPPCELMFDSFLPEMRGKIARRLADEGMSQGRIASLLGVTQASVSLYLKSETRADELLGMLDVSRDEGQLYASLLAEDLKKNQIYAVNTLYSLWSELLGRGAMCRSHRSLYPQLAQCDVCLRTFGVKGGPTDAIEHVAEAVRMVEGSQAFVRIMPEVSVNIAYAPDGASSTREIIAVPGRIVRVRGAAKSFMRPEYGASTHVARVLLVMMAHDTTIRACMNVRYDARMQHALRRAKLQPLVLSEAEARTESELLSSLKSALGVMARTPVAVVDQGATGLEPCLYLFANDARRVAQVALKLAREYSAAV